MSYYTLMECIWSSSMLFWDLGGQISRTAGQAGHPMSGCRIPSFSQASNNTIHYIRTTILLKFAFVLSLDPNCHIICGFSDCNYFCQDKSSRILDNAMQNHNSRSNFATCQCFVYTQSFAYALCSLLARLGRFDGYQQQDQKRREIIQLSIYTD